MKTAMLFVGEEAQAILTPETEEETILLKAMAGASLVSSLHWAEFYLCRGGYYRLQTRDSTSKGDSLIVRLHKPEPEPGLAQEPEPVAVEARTHNGVQVKTPHGDATISGPYLAVAYVGDLAGFGVGDQCQCDFPCPVEANTRWDVCAKCHLPTFPVKGGSAPPPKGRV